MAAVDTIVFDIGNVLIRWSPHNLYRRMGYSDAETSAILIETGVLEINHRVLDAGRARFADAMAELAARHPRHAAFLAAFDTRWTDMLAGPIESSVAMLRALRRSGYPVHAISNFSREKLDAALALFPFLDEFDERIVSADVGLVKPDKEIFELLLSRRSLQPERCVFIDDVAANIATASSLGMHTIHFADGTTDLCRELAALGVRP